jgi:hypothetical protein
MREMQRIPQYRYFPLIDGSEWVYAELGGSGLMYVQLEIGASRGYGHDLYFHHTTVGNDEYAWTRHMRLRQDEIYLVDRFGEEEGPLLRLPMSVEQNWAYPAGHQMVVRCFMVDMGDVHVPAGTFPETLKVEYVYSSGFNEAEFYAPGVGLLGYVERYEEEDKTYRLLYYQAGDGSTIVGTRPDGLKTMSRIRTNE